MDLVELCSSFFPLLACRPIETATYIPDSPKLATVDFAFAHQIANLFRTVFTQSGGFGRRQPFFNHGRILQCSRGNYG
jgi:hypothetical protein